MQYLIRSDKDFVQKLINFDCIFLLNNLKSIKYGLDINRNKKFNYYEALMTFLKINKGSNE